MTLSPGASKVCHGQSLLWRRDRHRWESDSIQRIHSAHLSASPAGRWCRLPRRRPGHAGRLGSLLQHKERGSNRLSAQADQLKSEFLDRTSSFGPNNFTVLRPCPHVSYLLNLLFAVENKNNCLHLYLPQAVYTKRQVFCKVIFLKLDHFDLCQKMYQSRLLNVLFLWLN